MTKRPYGQGRTERAPEARMTPEALEALKAILDKDGVSYADWLEAKITEDTMSYLLSVKEIAETLNRSESTIRSWMSDYKLSEKKDFVPTIENVEKMGNDHGVGNMQGNLISHYALKH